MKLYDDILPSFAAFGTHIDDFLGFANTENLIIYAPNPY